MSISIAYFDDIDKILFSCPNNDCPIRERLIANLTAAGITFQDNGAGIFVNPEEFTSTDDIAEKAFAGFSEIEDFKEHEHSDPTGTNMTFGYIPIIPLAKDKTVTTLNTSMETAATKKEFDGFKKQFDDLQVNSKELLDEHYHKLRPSLH